MSYRVEPLGGHDRAAFTCGDDALDRYFHTLITQDQKRGYVSAHVAVDEADGQVAGFYTLAATSLNLENLPQDLARKLPKYPLVPAVLIGRLAVRSDWQGRGLGGDLLLDALLRVLNSDVGAYAAVVLPKNDAARRFYAAHGFAVLAGRDHMFLPLATVKSAI